MYNETEGMYYEHVAENIRKSVFHNTFRSNIYCLRDLTNVYFADDTDV
jgi:hypothetical protein